MDPLVAAFFVEFGDPSDLSSDPSPFSECRRELVSDAVRASNFAHER